MLSGAATCGTGGGTHPLDRKADHSGRLGDGFPVGVVAGIVTEDQRAPRSGRQRGPGEKSLGVHAITDNFDSALGSFPVSKQPAPCVQADGNESPDVGMTGSLIVPRVDIVADEQRGRPRKLLNGLDGLQVMVPVNDVGARGKIAEIGDYGDSLRRDFGRDLAGRRRINHGLER